MRANHVGAGQSRNKSSGMSWTVAAMLLRQVGRIGFAVLIARLIGPEEYAAVAVAAVYIALTGVLLETGFGAAIVQRPSLTSADIASATWLSMGLGLTASILTLALSSEFAELFGVEASKYLVEMLAVTPLLKCISVVPINRLIRHVLLREAAKIEIVATLLGMSAAVFMLVLEARAEVIVLQQVVTDLLVAVMALIATKPHAFRTSRASLIAIFRFAFPVACSQIVGQFTRNIDNMIVGNTLGPQQLSLYSAPYRFMIMPVTLLSSVAARLLLPFAALMQNSISSISRLCNAWTRSVAVLVSPITGIAFFFAQDIVLLVLGPEWTAASNVVSALALVLLLQACTTHVGPALLGTGKTRQVFWWSVIPVPLCLVGFIVGLRWGIEGVAYGYLIATIIVTAGLVVACARNFKFSACRGLLEMILFCAAALIIGFLSRLVAGAIGATDLASGSLVVASVFAGVLQIVLGIIFYKDLNFIFRLGANWSGERS